MHTQLVNLTRQHATSPNPSQGKVGFKGSSLALPQLTSSPGTHRQQKQKIYCYLMLQKVKGSIRNIRRAQVIAHALAVLNLVKNSESISTH